MTGGSDTYLFAGTPDYMSPEQWTGSTIDSRSDIYSCGVMLYVMLTGQLPFVGEPEHLRHRVLTINPPAPSSISHDVPASLDAVVLRAMAKQPSDRFPSSSAFLEAVRTAVASGRDSEAAPRVSVLSIAGSASRIGSRYRFQIRVEGDNQSNRPLGLSGVTINVPTMDSRERCLGTEIQMSSLGCDPPFRHGPGEVIWGFRDDGSFGEKIATCLLMESTCEQWPPHERIALEAVLFTSCRRLDLHVRVWSTWPKGESGDAFGDPDWKTTAQRDQQGIPAYPLSLGFD
jgi:serine/threonine protein kinase